MGFSDIKKIIQSLHFDIDYWNVRYVERQDETLEIKKNVLAPPFLTSDKGLMITVFHKGGQGYAATPDLSSSGIKKAFDTAKKWALLSSDHSLIKFDESLLPINKGEYKSNIKENWFGVPMKTKLEKLKFTSEHLKTDARIVDWESEFWAIDSHNYFLSSSGSEHYQHYQIITPHQKVVGFANGISETRTFGGFGMTRQGGYEVLDEVGFSEGTQRLPIELIELLEAPNCPSGTMPVLLEPDQMILQIHESIGHPIELDRILGDERNYAGTSFVTSDMFGSYQYGSPLLNVTFDPHSIGESASYNFDDEGTKAQKSYLIEKGILKAGLGGSLSQRRSGLKGTANSRSVGWNRPPIDRMANLNLEPGKSSMEEMISAIEDGVLMKTNCSWSIDDSRNKFQFGCEYGRLIKNGKLGHVVRKPNYRGISANFWKNLSHVGDKSTMATLGTPFCGKGEPNQAITVGHASPSCVFKDIQVFGGE